MDIFKILTMIGGLCLFLFGMNLMGQALERRAGGKLRTLLDKMTSNVFAGFLTGLGVTAIIQSSSATTVMVVGFVNSGLMTLRQAINVIMGANVGTTVTAWLLSLAGIDSGNVWINLLKPASFTPILALIGIIFYMFCKDTGKKDTGMILLGFATLMFGMDTMSGAMAGLKNVPGFTELFIMFKNPILGVLVGAVLTAVIQSSSASVGILQALALTGQVSYAAAIPIIMGQNIGTCVTAIISSIGTTKNAKRAAVVHLMFNVIGVVALLVVFCIVKAVFAPAILNESATMYGIAIAHSLFNVLCTALLLPAGGVLEKLAIRLVPDSGHAEQTVELDERLLATPSLALCQCRAVTIEMAGCAVQALKNALACLTHFTPELAEEAAQETFLSAWQGLPFFRGDSAFSTWLYRLASNACVDLLRKEGRHQGPSLDDEAVSAEVPDTRPTPEAAAEQKELRAQIEAGLRTLSPEHREVLILREIQQLSYDEIADALSLDLGTVKSRISRGRRQLRNFLMEQGNFSAPAASKKPERGL